MSNSDCDCSCSNAGANDSDGDTSLETLVYNRKRRRDMIRGREGIEVGGWNRNKSLGDGGTRNPISRANSIGALRKQG